MEHRQLLHFLAAYEEKSFSSAAKRCHISPQGLSISIGQLEKELKVPLFFRTPQGIEITEYGRALKRAANSYTNYHDQIISEIRELELKTGSYLSIALADGFFDSFPRNFFKNFILAYPEIDFNITSFQSDICQESMTKLNIPLGFSDAPINAGLFNSMYSSLYKVHLVTGKQHRFACRSSVKLAELRNDKVIMINNHMYPQEIVTKLCIHEDIKPSIVLGPSDYNFINELCATGRIVSFWAGLMDLMPDLVSVAVDDFDSLYWEFHFIVNQSVHLNDAAHKFIAYTKENLFPGQPQLIS